jgi:hypothetical protein
MPETRESLRSELVRRRGDTGNRGFPSDLRDRVATFVRVVRTTRVPTSVSARDLGISRQSLGT